MRRLGLAMLLALLAVGLVACGGDSDDDEPDTTATTAGAAAAGDDDGADVAADDEADSDAADTDEADGDSAGGSSTTSSPPPAATVANASAAVEAVEGSGVSGTATLAKEGGRTNVTVAASGLAGPAHAVYITQDGCGTGGRIGPLTLLEPDAEGAAESSTLMVTAIPAILGGYVAIYEGGDGAGAIIACGEIVADAG